jgi:tetratricopeptide (TPR) repeat protein
MMQKVDFFTNVNKFVNRFVRSIDQKIKKQVDENEKSDMFTQAQSIYFSFYSLENLLVTYFQDIYEQSDKFNNNFFECLSLVFSGDFGEANSCIIAKTKEDKALSYIIPIIESILNFDFETTDKLFIESINTKSIYLNNLFYAIFLDEVDEVDKSRDHYIQALKKAKSEYERLRVLYFITYQDYQLCKVSQEVLYELEYIKDYTIELKALIYHNIALAYSESGYIKEAEEYADMAISIFSKDELREQLASTLILKAQIKEKLGEYEKANDLYTQIQNIITPNQLEYAKSLNGLANIYHHTHKYEDALKLHKEALKFIDPNRDKFELAITHSEIAKIFEEVNANAEAISAYKVAIESVKNLGNRPIYLQYYIKNSKRLANLYRKVNDIKNAKETLLNMYEMQKLLFVKNQSEYTMDMIKSLEQIAEVFYLAGDYNRSLEVNQTLFESFKYLASFDENFKSNMADSLNAIAVIVSQNKPFEAIDKFNEALTILNREFLEQPLQYGAKVATIIINIGLIYRKLNQTELAKSMIKEAVEIIQNLIENNILFEDMILINALNSLAHICIETKELEEAKEYYEKLVEFLSDEHKYNFLLARAYLELGALELDLQDIEGGIATIQKAYDIYKTLEGKETEQDKAKCIQIASKYGHKLY